MERKLAAILSADVVGYSRLMGADEDDTLQALRSHRQIVDALIGAHRGRVFNTAGDSVVAEFPSAVEASLCAVEIQKEVARLSEPVPTDRRLLFRIGINIGDVVAEGENLLGDGVNIADRVQKLAEPGGVCVSRNVYDQLTSKVGFKLEPMGSFRVKNIASAISVYRLHVGDAPGRRSIVRLLPTLARVRRRTIAIAAVALAIVIGSALFWVWQQGSPARDEFPLVSVLRFQNFSRDAALDSYSDGLAEDLTTVMARFPNLTVVSRTSSFAAEDRDIVTANLRQDQSVDDFIEGSVQKKGSEVRINAQLIDANTKQTPTRELIHPPFRMKLSAKSETRWRAKMAQSGSMNITVQNTRRKPTLASMTISCLGMRSCLNLQTLKTTTVRGQSGRKG